MKKFVLIFVTAVAVASVSVFAAYNLPENTDASKYETTHTMASTVINKKPAEFTTSPNVDMTGFELTKNSLMSIRKSAFQTMLTTQRCLI